MNQLIFVGLRGYVAALDRDTGRTLWVNKELKRGYTSMLLDGDRLIVASNGYLYCLDPFTGSIRWHNPLTGLGLGVASLTSVRGRSDQVDVLQAAQAAADQAANAG